MERRRRVALLAALALPCFSGQGAASNGGMDGNDAVFLLNFNGPASIVTSPSSTTNVAGASVELTVLATGKAPLRYQWRKNGDALGNSGGHVTGATSASLTLAGLTLADAGSYAVVVSNLYASATSAVAVLTVLPKVTINSPAGGARSNAPVTFRGTVLDNVPVTRVNYWITNLNGSPLTQGQAVLTAGSGSASNWAASVSPPAGSNVFAVQSQDVSGNQSQRVSLQFFVKAAAPLTLTTTGNGQVKGASFIRGDTAPTTNGAMLNVGEAYSITATPALNNYLSNWSGTSLTAFGASNGLRLNFIMETNTTITANFITNRFVGMAGIYNGLFSSGEIGTNTEETAGMISGLTLTTRGVYSATVLLGGSGEGISGIFTPDGYATNTVVVTNGVRDGNVTVELYCDGINPPRTIHGFVIGTNAIILPNGTLQTNWQSEVALVASLTNTSNFASAYTMLIPPATNANGTNSPTGYGYAVLTNTLLAGPVAAAVTLTGLLPDWASIATTTPIREDNTIPVYLNYYNTEQPGMLFGTVSLSSNTITSNSAALTWIRKRTSYGLFTNGFTNYYSGLPVSPWLKSAPLSNVITTNELVLSGGGLTTNLTNWVALKGTNLVRLSGPTNSGSGSVNTNTGKLTITFTNGSGRSRVIVTGQGAILQNTNLGNYFGGGFFIMGPAATPTNSGSISLQLPSP